MDAGLAKKLAKLEKKYDAQFKVVFDAGDSMAVLGPEQLARQQIDAMLQASGWAVQDYRQFDPCAALGVALREAPLKSGRCDYLLLIDRKAAGVSDRANEGPWHARAHAKTHYWDLLHSHRVEAARVEAPSRRVNPAPKVEAASRRLSSSSPSSKYTQPQYQRPVWQKESYDHIIRSEASLLRIIGYIRGHSAWTNKRRDAASTLLERARVLLVNEACAPFDSPPLRDALTWAKQESEQTIDTVTMDTLIEHDYSSAAKDKAQGLIRTFRDYIDQHKAEITALEILYSRPYKQRLTETMLKELEEKLRATDAAWTEDTLWRAFEATAPEKVKGRSAVNRFADLVPLVRFALEQQPVLEPFAQSVHERFHAWLQSKQSGSGVATLDTESGSGVPPLELNKRRDAASTFAFTPDQLAWLELIRDHIATSLSIEPDDFDYAPFAQRGGLGKAYQLFGDQLDALIEELNKVLAA